MKYSKIKKSKIKKSKTKKFKNNRKTIKKKNNIKLVIKNLGKKTKKYKRIQYGCNKTMKGGGPLFQPFTYISREAENLGNNTYNTMYGYDNKEYSNY